MTGQQAKALAQWYRTNILTNTQTARYLNDMAMRMQEIPVDHTGKLMRWLGFLQGALWAAGFYTVEELKEHSRMASHAPDQLVLAAAGRG